MSSTRPGTITPCCSFLGVVEVVSPAAGRVSARLGGSQTLALSLSAHAPMHSVRRFALLRRQALAVHVGDPAGVPPTPMAFAQTGHVATPVLARVGSGAARHTRDLPNWLCAAETAPHASACPNCTDDSVGHQRSHRHGICRLNARPSCPVSPAGRDLPLLATWLGPVVCHLPRPSASKVSAP